MKNKNADSILWQIVNDNNIPVEYMEIRYAVQELLEMDAQINVYNEIYFPKNENIRFAGWKSKDKSIAEKIAKYIENDDNAKKIIFGNLYENGDYEVFETIDGWHIIWNYREFLYIDKSINPNTWTHFIKGGYLDKDDIKSGIYNEFNHFKVDEKEKYNKLYNYAK